MEWTGQVWSGLVEAGWEQFSEEQQLVLAELVEELVWTGLVVELGLSGQLVVVEFSGQLVVGEFSGQLGQELQLEQGLSVEQEHYQRLVLSGKH